MVKIAKKYMKFQWVEGIGERLQVSENALLNKDVAFKETFYVRDLVKSQTTSHAICLVTLVMLITK
jgi:hypothetical protein